MRGRLVFAVGMTMLLASLPVMAESDREVSKLAGRVAIVSVQTVALQQAGGDDFWLVSPPSYSYGYDQSGRLIWEVWVEGSYALGQGYDLVYWRTNKYDEKGRLIEKASYGEYGNLMRRFTYAYNEAGDIFMFTDEDVVRGQKVYTSYRYEYVNGRINVKESIVSDEVMWREKYTYDDKGQLAEKVTTDPYDRVIMLNKYGKEWIEHSGEIIVEVNDDYRTGQRAVKKFRDNAVFEELRLVRDPGRGFSGEHKDGWTTLSGIYRTYDETGLLKNQRSYDNQDFRDEPISESFGYDAQGRVVYYGKSAYPRHANHIAERYNVSYESDSSGNWILRTKTSNREKGFDIVEMPVEQTERSFVYEGDENELSAYIDKWLKVADLGYKEGNWGLAIRNYERVLLVPKSPNPRVFVDLGTAYYRANRANAKKAIELFDRALMSDSKLVEAALNKAIMMAYGLNKRDAAIEILTRLKGNTPDESARILKALEAIAGEKPE